MTGHPPLQPFDQHNQKLQSEVAPTNWVNPQPAERYNLVVVGAGTAGLVAAASAAGLGAKVALVERDLMGGDCLNVGCVPSKALISAARTAAAARQASEFGIHVGDVRVDFAAVMERMRRLRADISPHDSAARFTDLGVDVFLGEGRFTGRNELTVGDTKLRFSKAAICTGARAALPDIDGLSGTDPLTNETVFSLTELPARLAVIGGGPIGCELAQCFARFGSHVTLFERSSHILSREDTDAAQVVAGSLRQDGVDVRCDTAVEKVHRSDDGWQIHFENNGDTAQAEFDHLLLAIGRRPNVDGLGLEAADVHYDEQKGIEVNDRLQTSNSNIYAAGDVASKYKFTHAADFLARTVIQNALFPGSKKASRLVIPWCTYTSPELAHVGHNEQSAEDAGIEFDTYTSEFEDNDRAVLEGETEGFVKVLVKQGTDEILGATIVGPHAGDLIHELTLALTVTQNTSGWKQKLRLSRGIGLSQLSNSIHSYPTLGDAVRRLGDQYNKTRLTPFVKKLMSWWFARTR